MASGQRVMIVTFLICFLLNSACSKQSKVIVVSMDGFRHDYLDMAKSQGRNISAFEDLYSRGFRGRLMPVMPTITFPTHFSTATGRYVENHGIMNNVFYSPQQNATFSYKNSADAQDSQWWNYNKNEPLWMTNERLGHKSCVFFWPGSASSYNGKFPTKYKLVYNSSIPFKSRVDGIIQWMREDNEITLCMLYMREPDHTGHEYGPYSKEVMDRVEELNDVVDYLVRLVNATPDLRDSVNIILTSDHGMAEVPKENRGPTVQEMYTKLIQANLTGASIYLKEDFPTHYYYTNSTRTPPLVVVAHIGYAIFTRPPRYHLKGDHGYDNEDKRMHASLVAAGPNLNHFGNIQVIQQADIYPLVCGLLNLTEPNKIDGNILHIVDFINPKPSDEFIRNYMFHAEGGPPPGASVKISFGVLSIFVLLVYLV
nr:ectonucleotide pyrophosphatase:phosphodiesterase [Hymenolepis microstoma]